MTLEVDLVEFRAAYLAEMDELTVAAEEAWSALGEAFDEGRPAVSHVRDLLRAVHTVKGISAMMNAEPTVELAHELEELLRAIDGGGVALADVHVGLAREALRGIAERLAETREGRNGAKVPEAFLASLREAAEAAWPPERAAPFAATPPRDVEGFEKLEAHERARLDEAASSAGMRAVRISFVPSPEKAAAGLTIGKVRERLAERMEIVRVVPTTSGGKSTPGGLTFLVFGTTQADDDVLAAVVGEGGAVMTLAAGAPAAQPPSEHPPVLEPSAGSGQARAGQLRVDPKRVDAAIERVSAMIVTRSRLALALSALEHRSGRSAETREMATALQESARQLRDTRAALLELRMVPTSELMERLPLVLRDLKRTSPKLVRLETAGGSVELDKVVADRVFPALVHLVRNAFDHGVEPPAARAAAGKPDEAVISVAFRALSNARIELRVADDGAGIDRARVVAVSGEARSSKSAPDDIETLSLLCRPGLSTKSEASRASGRGMGMDIVRKVLVDELGGALRLTSAEGEGTAFVAELPITVGVLDGFKVRVGDQVFVAPVAHVDEIVEIDPARVIALPRVGASAPRILQHRSGSIALFSLAALLGVPAGSERQALIVTKSAEPIALTVDRVFGQVETVVRPLEDPLVRLPALSGTTDLGDGEARLVVDILALASQATLRGARATTTREARTS